MSHFSANNAPLNVPTYDIHSRGFVNDGFMCLTNNKLNPRKYGAELSPDYCVVNAARHKMDGVHLSSMLQPVTERLRENEGDAVMDFVARMHVDKQLWRGVNVHARNNSFTLKTETKGSMKHTGVGGDLIVGEAVFCLPAIISLSAIRPAETMFNYRGKPYAYPMTMSKTEHDMLMEDVAAISEEMEMEEDAGAEAITATGGRGGGGAPLQTFYGRMKKAPGDALNPAPVIPRTLIGGLLYAHRYALSKSFGRIWTYLASQKPVGVIKERQAVSQNTAVPINTRQTTIPIGVSFTVHFNV